MWLLRVGYFLLLLPFLLAIGLCARAAESQPGAVQAVQPPAAAQLPIVVCPPKYTVPLFVPADELLRQAKQTQPETPEGWIIRHRPVLDCNNYVGDAAAREEQFFHYPLKLRQYNTQIRMLQAELASWNRRLANYNYFNKGGALPVTVENTWLYLLATQERLRNVRYERMLFFRLQEIERQLHQGVPVNEPVVYSN